MKKWMLIFLMGMAVAQDYGMAGCGLGSVALGDKKQRYVQIFAATMNLTLLNSFSITSGTANCVEEGLVEEETARLFFLEAHKDLLLVEAARGEKRLAENLQTFYPCVGSEALQKSLQGDMGFWSGLEARDFSFQFDQKMMQSERLCVEKPNS